MLNLIDLIFGRRPKRYLVDIVNAVTDTHREVTVTAYSFDEAADMARAELYDLEYFIVAHMKEVV